MAVTPYSQLSVSGSTPQLWIADTDAEIASITGQSVGDDAFALDTKKWKKWDGTAWVAVSRGTDLTAHEGAADPHTGYQKESEKGAVSGYAGLDAGTKVPTAQLGSGTADGTTFLRGDQTYAAPAGGHAQSHVLADGTGLGPDHTVSGAAAGEVLRALNATTAAFDQLGHGDLGSVTADQHHPQAHAIGGADHSGSITSGQHGTIGSGDLHTEYQKESEKAAASGYAGLDAGTKVPTAQLGSGTADATTFLRGDQTYAVPPGGGGADIRQVEVDLGGFQRSGKFTISDAAILAGTQMIVTQAAGPYTGKGDRADEAEMDQVTCAATVTGAGSADVYWHSEDPVAGNFKFAWLAG